MRSPEAIVRDSACRAKPPAWGHVPTTSTCYQHLKVWPHQAVDAKGLRDSMKLVQIKASASSSLNESLEDNVRADLAPKPEAFSDGAGNAVDPHALAFDAMILDSDVKQWCRNPRHAKRRVRQTRNACAARNCEPHLAWQLGANIVEAKG
jgi:hypothetical protein